MPLTVCLDKKIFFFILAQYLLALTDYPVVRGSGAAPEIISTGLAGAIVTLTDLLALTLMSQPDLRFGFSTIVLTQ